MCWRHPLDLCYSAPAAAPTAAASSALPQERGFTDFLRLGSLKRMARPMLAHSVHAAGDKQDAASQLQEMLAQATSPGEVAMIKWVPHREVHQRHHTSHTPQTTNHTSCMAMIKGAVG